MLTEPPKTKSNLFNFQSSEIYQNVDLDATKTMVSIKTGIESQTYNLFEIFEFLNKSENPKNA